MLRLEELGRIDIDKAKNDNIFNPDTLQTPLTSTGSSDIFVAKLVEISQ
jgi:hypothetical protein